MHQNRVAELIDTIDDPDDPDVGHAVAEANLPSLITMVLEKSSSLVERGVPVG